MFPSRQLINTLAVFVAIFLGIISIRGIFEIQNTIKEGKFIGLDVKERNTIEVSGEGKVTAIPDIAQIQLSVVSQAKTVAQATKDNTQKMNTIVAFLKEGDIDEKDIKTTNYSVSPQYDYSEFRTQPTITGYQVDQTVTVKVRKLDAVGDVIDGATSRGANQVGGLNFTIDEPKKLEAEARKEAIANARAQAQVIARELGASLGRVVSFSESSGGFPPPIYFARDLAEVGGVGGGAPSIQPGENEVVVNVSVTYEIL
ncbi:MAG: SIMPL domain-containing protein [Parcubacteria group bacterium]|nr:SIMPL domain-containing protein [Parcubacteria group bacterium]